MEELRSKFADAIWVGESIFRRNKTSGSSANMSFRHGDRIYITGSGTCFGRLTEGDFSVLDLGGNLLSDPKPSKEYPLHLLMYRKENIGAVIHTHGTHCVLWSCVSQEPDSDFLPSYTPYLDMKLGPIQAIGYYAPGSQELFRAVGAAVDDRNGYVLKNHGAVVRGKSIMDAFYGIEELEESARIAFLLEGRGASRLD